MNRLSRWFATALPKLTLQDLGTNPLLNFVATSDFYRVDVGVILNRRPIYFDLDEPEFQQMKAEHKINTKYDLYSLLTEDLTEFDRSSITSPTDTNDDQVTHIKRNPDGTITNFRPRSKNFRFCQPDVFDPHRIQTHGMYNVFYLVKRGGKWQFPQEYATQDLSLNHHKEAIISKLTKNEFSVLFTSKFPLCVQRAPIPQADIDRNPLMAKFVGRKIFFFQAFHDVGNSANVYQAEDYAWVPKPLLNKYLPKEDFDALMPHLRVTRN